MEQAIIPDHIILNLNLYFLAILFLDSATNYRSGIKFSTFMVLFFSLP